MAVNVPPPPPAPPAPPVPPASPTPPGARGRGRTLAIVAGLVVVAAAVVIGVLLLGGDDGPGVDDGPQTASPSASEQPARPVEVANPEPIAIDDAIPASPYPSTIQVSGAFTEIGDVNVTIDGLSHGFADDVDVLLVGPSGASVVLLSDTGGAEALGPLITLTFDDEAASPVPDEVAPLSGSFRPTRGPGGFGNCCDFQGPPPAPSAPYGAELAVFDGTDPNGSWSLYVFDDSGGDVGEITGGWSLEISPPGAEEPAPQGGSGATGATGADVALRDDFSDPASGWGVFSDDVGEARYENGTYVITAKQGGSSEAVFRGDVLADLGDADIAARAQPLEDFFGLFYGVACRRIGDHYYELSISTDGRYEVARHEGGTPTFLDQGSSSAINTGFGENLIEARCTGSGDGGVALTLVVNGTPVADVVDPTALSLTGPAGLFVGTEEAAPASVAFDDVVVTRP